MVRNDYICVKVIKLSVLDYLNLIMKAMEKKECLISLVFSIKLLMKFPFILT